MEGHWWPLRDPQPACSRAKEKRAAPALAAFAGSLHRAALWCNLLLVPSLVLAVTASLLALAGPSALAQESPQISPTPQSVQLCGEGVTLGPVVGLVTGAIADPATVEVVRDALQQAGVAQIVLSQDSKDPNTALTIWIGGPAENAGSAQALASLGAPAPASLPVRSAEGYVLAIGRDAQGRSRVVLAGNSTAGTFYAAQTFRQIVAQRSGRNVLPGLVIRDWPGMAWRGVIEGFYGPPWSQDERLSQLAFYGAHKMNTYVYAPKDDPYHRERWRDPYPPDKLADLAALVQAAQRNHVQFVFAISPGLSVRYSDDADFRALTAKAQALWDVGVRSFAILLDDIQPVLQDPQDQQRFGADASPLAAAQAYLLNRFQKEFIATHPGATRLITVPTEYYQAGASPYRNRFAELVDPSVLVLWTGIGVVAPTVTAADASSISDVFKHDLLLWDNYPVNDYSRNRLFLGPLVGRAPDLADHGVVGLVANPMVEGEASKIPLFTVADYTWNPAAYDPERSFQLSVQEFGGQVADALRTFAENSRSSPISTLESPQLSRALEEFRKEYAAGDAGQAAEQLLAEFQAEKLAPARLRQSLPNDEFLEEAYPFFDKMTLQASAGEHAVRMLQAQDAGDGATAWQERLALEDALDAARSLPYVMAPGVLDPFFEEAREASGRWLGARSVFQPLTSMGYSGDNVPGNMMDGDQTTFYWSDRAPIPDDYVGIDLGAVQAVHAVQVLMGSTTGPNQRSNDYIHSGILEASADGVTWLAIREVHEQPEVKVEGLNLQARYIRLRVTAPQQFWVQVREFSATGDFGTVQVSGGPQAAAGSSLQAAADGNVRTAYRAAGTPQAGDALTVVLPEARPLQAVTILQDAAKPAAGMVQVRTPDGRWTDWGSLTGGYTELRGSGEAADMIRIVWAAGSPAPVIYEIVPWYRDTVVDLSTSPSRAVVNGGEASATLRLQAAGLDPVAGELTVVAPAGWQAQPERVHVRVSRGHELSVPLRVSVPAGTLVGSYPVEARFVADPAAGAAGGGAAQVDGSTPAGAGLATRVLTATLTVDVVPRVANRNLARGAKITASSVSRPAFAPELAADGNGATRWSSEAADGEWLQVELAEPARIAKVVVKWGAAYAAAYQIQVSQDGEHWTVAANVENGTGGTDTLVFNPVQGKFVRLQGVRRGTQGGYSVYEFEVYPEL